MRCGVACRVRASSTHHIHLTNPPPLPPPLTLNTNPINDRAAVEAKEELLLPRAARLKPEEREALGLAPDDTSGSEDEGTPARGGGGSAAGRKRNAPPAAAARRGGGGASHHKKKHVTVAGGEPGPPVDGAALRVDEWWMDVDEQGRPLQVRSVGVLI